MAFACVSYSNLLCPLSPYTLSECYCPCISADNIKNAEIVEEREYYKIINVKSMYYYYIFDENHDVAKTGGPFNKRPSILELDNHIKFILQAGTGIGTQWGFYYDIKKDAFSRIYQCIYDQYDGKVAYGDVNKVILRDIFDKTIYYQEISNFKEAFSEVAEPVTNVKFVDDGTSVEVSYLTGSNYQEITESFKLVMNYPYL
jgi:hypothetical protein